MEEVAQEKKVKEVNVYPLSKGKRTILYLSDFFVTFIFAITLFTLAIHPLGELVVGLQSRTTQYDQDIALRDGVLYGNSLLYAKNAESRSFNEDMAYTSDLLIRYYTFQGAEPDEFFSSDFIAEAANEKYEVFKHYFVDIRESSSSWIAEYRDLDSSTSFFDIGEDSLALKSQYVDEFKAFYRENDTPSESAQTHYSSFQERIYLQGYRDVIASISEHDLTYEGVSYLAKQKDVASYMNLTEYLTVVDALIAYLLSALIVYLLFPLINKNRKTLSMLVLKRDRVDASYLTHMKKRKIPLLFVYQYAMSAWSLIFVPWGAVGVNELFSLPILLPISMISLVLVIVSLIMLIVDDFNRDLLDRLTFSVVVDEDELDKIYEAKGYKNL